MAYRIQQRRDTAANWAEMNPILLEGEMGLVTDNPNQYKIGDGVHTWNELPLRGYTGTISQEFGEREDAVVSQKVVSEKFSETEQKLSDIGSEVGVVKYKQGSVYNKDGILTYVQADTRIYTIVKGSVHIEPREGYKIYGIYKGVLGGSCESIASSNDVEVQYNEQLYIVFSKIDTTQSITANVDIPASVSYGIALKDYKQDEDIKGLKSEVSDHDLKIDELKNTPSLYVFNVNAYNNKLESETYNSVSEARLAVPEKYRRYGQIITYRLSSGWVTEQFVGIYLNPEGTAWIDEDGRRWVKIDNNAQTAISYLTFDTDASTTRLSVHFSERRINKIICYYNGVEFIVERYTYSDVADGPWQKDAYWERLNVPNEKIYNSTAIYNELADVIEQSYSPTSNIINPLKVNYNPLNLAIGSTFVARGEHVTFVVAKDVPIGKVVAFALIYGDLTNESLKELGINEIRLGISENYPQEGESVKGVIAGSPGLRERVTNENLDSNYVSVSFVTGKTGDEAIQVAFNALQYLVVEIQDSYKPITAYKPPYLFNIEIDIESLGGATKEDINRLQKEIEDIEGIETVIETLNTVKVVSKTTLHLGSNILTSNYSYDSNYWDVTNGTIKYKGSGRNSAFVFQTPTTNNQRYYAKITAYTENGDYEDLFMTQMGENDFVDVYNGSPSTNGGYISDGGYFKIIAFSDNKPFEIRSIELLPIVSKDESLEDIELKTDNVNAGNSEGTNINGKWNVAVGPSDSTMMSNVNGSRSIAIGLNALRKWHGGLQNIAIGTFALSLLEYGDRNVAVGSDCLWQVKRAFDNICLGKGALGKTGEYEEVNRNIAIGTHAAGTALPNIEDNVAIGYNAIKYGGVKNVAVGNETAGYVKGSNNVAIGHAAYYGDYSTGNNNVAIGSLSTIRDLQQKTGINNGVAIGYNATAGHNSIAIGANAVCNKRYQTVIGNENTLETKVFGDLIVQGTDGVKRKIVFNTDGTCTWESI